MKKIAICIIVLGIAFSYSCKKDGKEVSTTISGQLRTNGTEDIIKISTELSLPKIDVYRAFSSGGGDPLTGSADFEIISSTPINSDGSYSITLDLNTNDEYFIGFSNIDQSVYLPNDYSFYSYDKNAFNHIDIGGSNNIILYCSAISCIQPRFINTNPDPSNNDVFEYRGGLPCDNCESSGLPPVFHGFTDSTLYWVGMTWSGTYREGAVDYNAAHKVEGKLTRNGVTIDTSIIYIVPPLDTTVVEIRY